MSRRAVVFDLDDTLIVEVSFAMASLREAISVFPGIDPAARQADALEAVRSVWRRGADLPVCVELGFASWEGLWSTFEGNHDMLDGLRGWAPTYRAEAWPPWPPGSVHRIPVSHGGPPSGSTPPSAGAIRPSTAWRTLWHASGSGHPVGLLTNGPSDLQRLKLDAGRTGGRLRHGR